METNDSNSNHSPHTTDTPHQKKSMSPLKQILVGLSIVLFVGVIVYGLLMVLSQPNSLNKTTNNSNKSKEIPKLTIINQESKKAIYLKATGSDYSNIINFQIFEGLVRYEDQSKIVPALATSWTNPDELTWRFNLKKGVKFHTGRTMTADDVVYSFEQAKKNDFINELYMNSIESAKKISPTIVEIKTVEPDPVILNKLTFIHIIDSKSDIEAGIINGTGPYTLKKNTVPSDDKLELVAYDDYHQGRPLTRALTFLRSEEDEGFTDALLQKKANIAGEFNAKSSEKLDAKKFIKRNISDTTITFLLPNTIKPGPLQKVEVRQAIQYALDLPALIKANDVTATPYSQLIVEAIPGHNPAIKPVKRDIQKAKNLLIKAGYPNGFSLEIANAGGYKDMVTSELPKQLAEIGITVKNVSYQEFSEYLDSIANGEKEMSLLSYSSDTFDGADVLTLFTKQMKTYKSEKLDSLVQEASKTTDAKKRLKILQDASVLVSEDVPVIPLYNRIRAWYMDKDYQMKRDMPSTGMGVYFWKVHQ